MTVEIAPPPPPLQSPDKVLLLVYETDTPAVHPPRPHTGISLIIAATTQRFVSLTQTQQA